MPPAQGTAQITMHDARIKVIERGASGPGANCTAALWQLYGGHANMAIAHDRRAMPIPARQHKVANPPEGRGAWLGPMEVNAERIASPLDTGSLVMVNLLQWRDRATDNYYGA